jgi:DNA mismatch repair ATPase MutS
MNEIFTSTTLKDAVFLSQPIMERVLQQDALCICVTFLDELTTMTQKELDDDYFASVQDHLARPKSASCLFAAYMIFAWH